MESNIVLSDELLSSVAENLVALPDRIRDDTNGRYCYPESFQNKIFRFGNKILLFNDVSYEELTISSINFLLTLLLKLVPSKASSENTLENNSNDVLQLLETHSAAISALFKKLEELSNKVEELIIFKKSENVEQPSNQENDELEKIKIDIEEVNNKIIEVEDHISKFNELKNQLEKIVLEYDDINDEIKNQMQVINAQLENIKNSSNEQINEDQLVESIGNKIWDKLSPSLEKEEKEETGIAIYTEFKTSVEKQINELISKYQILSQSSNFKTTEFQEDNIISKLCHLKSAGYTVDDIISLKNNNIL